MKNFDKMELYKRLRKEDKSDDANKGNIEKVNLRNKIKNTIDKCHEKQPNIPRKELIYTVLEKYFYKESISNFAEEVGVSEDVIKHCLKLNSEGYYYGYRSLEKICKELGIN